MMGAGALFATPAPAADAPIASAADFEAAIARLEKTDPQAPEALNARLQYADFLAEGTTGDCQARLDAAQAQLDAVAARPATQVLLLLGPAKLKSGAYRIYAARADCDAAHRTDELNKALDAARDAAHLYRTGLDYESAAIMQFNVAATLHALGDSQAAIAALQSVIAMDKEFGFRDDGEDNIRLLRHWQGGDETPAKIAALMQGFPAPRTADLKFAWAANDGQMQIAATETNLTAGQIVQSKATIALARHVRPDGRSWTVSYDPNAKPSLDLGHWPDKPDVLLQRFVSYLLAIAVMETPDYTVTATGDFSDVRNAQAYSKALPAEVAEAFGTSAPLDGVNARTSKALAQNLKIVILPLYLGTDTAQNYSLQTATWAGAKLEQGAWYEMQAPLLLPGMGLGQYFLVTHDISFSYARAVPCTAGDSAKSCAEIVIHATPAPGDMAKAHIQMSSLFHMPDFDALHYWSSFDMRLVVRPDTLAPVLSDIRKSWFVGIDVAPKSDPAVSAERVVTTWTYNEPQAT